MEGKIFDGMCEYCQFLSIIQGITTNNLKKINMKQKLCRLVSPARKPVILIYIF